MRIKHNIVVLFIVVTLTISLGPYLKYWGSFNVSINQSDWIFFSTFFSNISSPIFLLITIILSILLSRDMRNIDELRKIIQLQSEEIDKQYDRDIYVIFSHIRFTEAVPKKMKIRDTLSLSKDLKEYISFSLEIKGEMIIDYGDYLKSIIHNLYALSKSLQEFNKISSNNRYLIGYYKRKFSFDLTWMMNDNGLPICFIKNDIKLNDITNNLLLFYHHDSWD